MMRRLFLCWTILFFVGSLPSLALAVMPSQADKMRSSRIPQSINQGTTPIISLSVTEPKSSQTPYVPGWPLTIKWTYADTPPGNAKVVLLKGTQAVYTFSQCTPWGSNGTGTLAATMPVNEFGFNIYKVKVVSTTSNAWSATSNEFISMPLLKVQSPTADGQTWKVGETHTITWKYSGGCGNKVSIKAITNSQWAYDLQTSWPIGSIWSGSFPWTISTSIPTGEYRIYFRSENSACNDRTAIIKIIH